MAIFELLELNDAIRKVVLTNPKPEAIRAVAAEQGHRSFQEEGIVAVALGLTSLQEIQKMMQGK
jgi:type II secretory ATPase GspE/PulE/Tfp pilus assembly ATPase PilB-like protein